MATLKEIRENLGMISTIKNIASTYQEIANLRMKQIREKVLKNREFFGELLNIYQRIKSAYLFSSKRGWIKETKTPSLPAKKERVVIFLSANHFFYGALISDVWSTVINYLKENRADLVVAGKVGKYLAESSGFGHKMFYFELNDEKPEERNIAAIVEFVKDYKKIIAFYGRYKTVLSQTPTMSEISELPFEESPAKNFGGGVKNYLFEPSPEAVLDFFETEIVATLFNQCILEHQLARYASRVIAMYRATENAKKTEQKLAAAENKLKRQILNKKQVELFGNIYANL